MVLKDPMFIHINLRFHSVTNPTPIAPGPEWAPITASNVPRYILPL